MRLASRPRSTFLPSFLPLIPPPTHLHLPTSSLPSYRPCRYVCVEAALIGKPLTLAPAEYAALTRQWVALAFDEVQRGEDELMMF